MQSGYVASVIKRNEKVYGNIYRMVLDGNFKGKPGQFYMLSAWSGEPYLSRPISINDTDGKSITFMYEVKGMGTSYMKKLKSGDSINVLGPLGNGFDTENIHGKIAVVSGGIGIAPMKYLLKELKGECVDVYAGFRDSSYMVDEIKEYANDIFISSENGKDGYKGYVTDLLNPWEYNVVICCGPKPMMKKVATMCDKCSTACLVSMEEHMACGIGACLVCSCDTKHGKKRVCKDGPVFWGRDVVVGA